jgi:hypothetical protein
MKGGATEHDHRVNDVTQATNQVVFGVPCVLDVKWRLVNSYQMARGWDRTPPPHSGSVSPSTPSSTGSQTVAKSRLAGFGISPSNGRWVS